MRPKGHHLKTQRRCIVVLTLCYIYLLIHLIMKLLCSCTGVLLFPFFSDNTSMNCNVSEHTAEGECYYTLRASCFLTTIITALCEHKIENGFASLYAVLGSLCGLVVFLYSRSAICSRRWSQIARNRFVL